MAYEFILPAYAIVDNIPPCFLQRGGENESGGTRGKERAYQHSASIAIQNNITLLQRRAWNVLLWHAYDDLPEKEIHHIQVVELARILGYDSHDQEYLKEALKALVNCIVEWNILDKDGAEEWGIATLLAGAKITRGMCSYTYEPMMRARLHNPSMYAKLDLGLQNRFESKYGQALWEICADYLGARRDQGETPFILLEEFKKLMGIADGMYPLYKLFSQRVLKPAVAEINKVSDFRVTVDYQRRGRKIMALKFRVKRLAGLLPVSQQPDFFPNLVDMPAVVQLLKDAGLAATDAWQVWQKGFDGVEEHVRPALNGSDPSEDFVRYVREKIDLLRQRQAQGKVVNASGFLLSAIRKNFANAEVEQKAVVASKKQKRQEMEKLKESITAIRREEEEAMHQVTRSMVDATPDLLDEALAEGWEKSDPVLRFCYNQSKTPMQNFQGHPAFSPLCVNICRKNSRMSSSAPPRHSSGNWKRRKSAWWNWKRETVTVTLQCNEWKPP